jgi:hypothetical protein
MAHNEIELRRQGTVSEHDQAGIRICRPAFKPERKNGDYVETIRGFAPLGAEITKQIQGNDRLTGIRHIIIAQFLQEFSCQR